MEGGCSGHVGGEGRVVKARKGGTALCWPQGGGGPVSDGGIREGGAGRSTIVSFSDISLAVDNGSYWFLTSQEDFLPHSLLLRACLSTRHVNKA